MDTTTLLIIILIVLILFGGGWGTVWYAWQLGPAPKALVASSSLVAAGNSLGYESWAHPDAIS